MVTSKICRDRVQPWFEGASCGVCPLPNKPEERFLDEVLSQVVVTANHAVEEPKQRTVVALDERSKRCHIPLRNRLHELFIGRLHPTPDTVGAIQRFAAIVGAATERPPATALIFRPGASRS